MYKALDILINIGCYALAAFVMYPGIKRLVEGPEVFMLNGQPGSWLGIWKSVLKNS
ncbi:hypothetical protein ACN09C_27670 (plasmid) [Serratia fonticola]|uniref:hypothetical protein n=1 Tax=Serratia fonticola TaxID=47917 RepID=UPI003B00ADD1